MKSKRYKSDLRKFYKNFYLNKYYIIWQNNFKIDGLDYQQNEWIFRTLWSVEGFASFIVDGTKGSTEYPQGMIVLTQFEPAFFNIYDYPTKCTLINKRGVSFIPNTMQDVDKDVIIMYGNKAHKPYGALLDPLFDKLALIECVIQINLNAHKKPFMIPVSPEDEKELKKIMDFIDADEEKIFIPSEQFDKIKILATGTNYIIDKLYAYKDQIECEIREYLGLNSLPVMEKKEHLISDEVESNNEVVDFSHDNIKNSLEDWIERFNKLFGTSLKLVDLKEQSTEESTKEEGENDEEDEL